ncbi:Diaminopimelate epimerase [Trichoplax sp. H2]|nr:Diaminopimelate epimerase [Trichoplax sp. H2]|eukprot:RDD41026.1 Diaminopimelate epimerase [Trichoplax sp. H2]
MHGLGNDFVIVNGCHMPKSSDIHSFAKEISDRELGVGCDQFIIYRQDSDKINMTIYNQDGSGAKACGNASRCLTRLLFDHTGAKNIKLDVDGRIVSGKYIDKNTIKVDMGPPSFESSWMPDSTDLCSLAERYMIEPKEMICVDVANPHLVISSKLSKKDMGMIGNDFQKCELFPDGVNVNFARIEDNKINLTVWERGTGFTYACGSGAIATFAAANKLSFFGDEAEIVFKLGSLKMQKQNDSVLMSGPASYVFTGEEIIKDNLLKSGSDAYPSNVFYLYSRLLKRAAKLSNEKADGSLKALPVVDARAADSGFFFERELFHKDLVPTVNLGISVRRVGSAAQIKVIEKVGSMKLKHALFREMGAFAQFKPDLNTSTPLIRHD